MYNEDAKKDSGRGIERPPIHLGVPKISKYCVDGKHGYVALSAQICLLELLKLYTDVLSREWP